MPVKFNRLNWVVQLGGNPLRLHCLLKALDAGRIGWKSIEMMPCQIRPIQPGRHTM